MAQAKKSPATNGGYGKRPKWQWIVLYLIIGGLLYLLIYMLFFGKDGGGVY